MDFLIYSRGAPAAASAEDDPGLNERHWSYMDGFADGLTARGPTLGTDRETWTGSMHVVDLPDAEAAREFVAREPYNRAGRYDAHVIWRFTNLVGRTMWELAGTPDEPRFLVLPQAAEDPPAGPAPVAVADLPPQLRDRLLLYGELRDLDDRPAGVALAVQVPSRAALDTLLADPRTGLADHHALRVHDWELGGRR